ncbi:hypothetical protein FB2170_09006 [Maribacter sp. HTCC2170]|nr:hypothetical protein FB2170_09006 [Maribacter sp. HTCC2170]
MSEHPLSGWAGRRSLIEVLEILEVGSTVDYKLATANL